MFTRSTNIKAANCFLGNKDITSKYVKVRVTLKKHVDIQTKHLFMELTQHCCSVCGIYVG